MEGLLTIPKRKYQNFGPIQEKRLDLRVSYLLTSDMKWNEARLEEFVPLLADQIKCLRPSETGAAYIFIWRPARSGKYSTKSGYFTTTMGEATTTLADPENFDWMKDIWKCTFSPKMRMFLWSITQNTLPFGANLQHKGIQSEACFKQCQAVETAMHTFFFCRFAQKVWDLIPTHKATHLTADKSFKGAITVFRKVICLPLSRISGNILPCVLGFLDCAQHPSL